MAYIHDIAHLSDQISVLLRDRPRRDGVAALATLLGCALRPAQDDHPDILDLQRLLRRLVAEILARQGAKDS